MVTATELSCDKSPVITWNRVYVRVDSDPPTLDGDQVISRVEWLWTCGEIAAITEKTVYADGDPELAAWITGASEAVSEGDSFEEDSIEE